MSGSCRAISSCMAHLRLNFYIVYWEKYLTQPRSPSASTVHASPSETKYGFPRHLSRPWSSALQTVLICPNIRHGLSDGIASLCCTACLLHNVRMRCRKYIAQTVTRHFFSQLCSISSQSPCRSSGITLHAHCTILCVVSDTPSSNTTATKAADRALQRQGTAPVCQELETAMDTRLHQPGSRPPMWTMAWCCPFCSTKHGLERRCCQLRSAST